MKEHITALHKKHYERNPERFYFAPGRVNLIGEHIDHSGGTVLPMAIQHGIYAAVSPRIDQSFRVFSEEFPKEGVQTITLDALDYQDDVGFLNYVKGVMTTFGREGCRLDRGLDITIASDLPAGAGLSSSAAFTLLVAYLLDDVHRFQLGSRKLIRMARYVENVYLRLNTGIMDQYIIANAKAGHALKIDTKLAEHEAIPFNEDALTLILMNTNKKRTLLDSNYNKRVRKLKEAEWHFERYRPIEKLCDLDVDTFKALRDTFKNQDQLKLVEHVIFENDRAKKATKALKEEDYEMLGMFMDQSHDSLRYLYEVSVDELDFLVEQNRSLGALGARLTGAGFGGSMIALYEKANVPHSFDRLRTDYERLFNRELDIRTVHPVAGVHRLKGAF